MKVGIDPGHGGDNFGTRSLGFPEKEYTLNLANRLASLLYAHGIELRMGRLIDEDIGFWERAARLQDCRFVVVLHVNANTDPRRHGMELYHTGEDPVAIAAASAMQRCCPEALHKGRSMFDVTNDPLDPLDDWLENPENTIEEHMARGGSALLVEVGYGSNRRDREYLLSDWGKRAVLATIAAGIIRAGEFIQELGLED